jgi:hypothetical protein
MMTPATLDDAEPATDRLLDVDEAGAVLGMSRAWLYRTPTACRSLAGSAHAPSNSPATGSGGTSRAGERLDGAHGQMETQSRRATGPTRRNEPMKEDSP